MDVPVQPLKKGFPVLALSPQILPQISILHVVHHQHSALLRQAYTLTIHRAKFASSKTASLLVLQAVAQPDSLTIQAGLHYRMVFKPYLNYLKTLMKPYRLPALRTLNKPLVKIVPELFSGAFRRATNS